MSTLPGNPNLEQLRHQARDLLRASRAGEPEASERTRSVSRQVTLAGAQLAIARGYGFPSWPALKAEVEALTRTLAEAVEAFLTASVSGRIGRAGQLLAQHPGISGHDFRTAVVLGDAARVSAQLKGDPDLAARRDPRTGWAPVHLACASRWHVDPVRSVGLLAIVGMLLDAGADLRRPPSDESQWSLLRCAVASAGAGRGNEPIVRLLLGRGAEVADHDLYLAGFAAAPGEYSPRTCGQAGEQWCVRLLVEYTPDVRAIAAQALAAPVSLNDADGVRVLLDAGADPRRYRDDDHQPAGVVLAALGAGCGLELIELLLAHGADPNQAGDDGRSAYAIATASGRGDLLELLERHGARDDTTVLDRLRYACLRGDRTGALRLLDQYPAVRSEVAHADGSALIGAAETGNIQAIELLLEVGFPAAAQAGSDGATALHVAAWAGSVEAVKRLLAAGAPPDAHDSRWHSAPLEWALVGSGERRATSPIPDWAETVRILLDAGAATSQVKLDPAEPIRPSPEVGTWRGPDIGKARRLVKASRTTNVPVTVWVTSEMEVWVPTSCGCSRVSDIGPPSAPSPFRTSTPRSVTPAAKSRSASPTSAPISPPLHLLCVHAELSLRRAAPGEQRLRPILQSRRGPTVQRGTGRRAHRPRCRPDALGTRGPRSHRSGAMGTGVQQLMDGIRLRAGRKLPGKHELRAPARPDVGAVSDGNEVAARLQKTPAGPRPGPSS